MNILVTGATGFIGSALCTQLVSEGHRVRAFSRTVGLELPGVELFNGAITCEADLLSALVNIDCVVHLAGRAHKVKDDVADPLVAFRAINRDATLMLAKCAAASGVKRFIFISSIGVNGSSSADFPFDERAVPAPRADYALSKWEAEEGLLPLMTDDFQVVIVRPPLVYAAHAPGNFARLLKLVSFGVPLPFASLNNQRSMIALENLVDFISVCITHQAAANELFLISDDEKVSTADIIRYLSQGMGKGSKLFPFSRRVMHFCARSLGKEELYIQLCNSLVIDCAKAKTLLGWKPVVAADQALARAGELYKQQRT